MSRRSEYYRKRRAQWAKRESTNWYGALHPIGGTLLVGGVLFIVFGGLSPILDEIKKD